MRRAPVRLTTARPTVTPMGIIDSIAIFFRGRQLAVVGPRAAGKTTLHTWLRSGELPGEYGLRWRHSPRRMLGLKSGRDEPKKMGFKKGVDVPGDVLTSLETWRQVVQSADIALVLFDVARTLDPKDDHGRELGQACSVLSAIISDDGSNGEARIALVGTHCDLVEGYVPPSASTGFVEFERMVRRNKRVEDALWNLERVAPERR